MTFYIDDFEQKVLEHADRVAIKSADGGELTYAELNGKANQLAHHLQSQDPAVNANDCVAICKERSLDVLVSMLACWKINAGFVLLDPNHSNQERMIEQCDVKTVITDSQQLDKVASATNKIILDDQTTQATIAECANTNPERDPQLDNVLAYYISTSGTTRAAKTVRINHTREPDSGLDGAFKSTAEVLNLTPDDTLLWNSPLTFDPIIAQMCGFLYGANLYVPNNDEIQDELLLNEHCADHQVNVRIVIPNRIEHLNEYSDSLQQINNLKFMTTGEALKPHHVTTLKSFTTDKQNNSVLVTNGYGPTEGPFGLTMTVCEEHEPVSIGNVMRGRRCDVAVFEAGQPRPALSGEHGELLYQSNGFAGYLDNDIATTERRVFYNGEYWWRTGDLVSRQDTLMEYHGRIDDSMIKIAGVRLELAGFEGELCEHEAVQEAHTLRVTGQDKRRQLVTFVQLKEGAEIGTDVLETYLRHHHDRVLMHKIVILEPQDRFGIYSTTNGKLDKRKLRERYLPHIDACDRDDTIEVRLEKYWKDIFGIAEIPENANFYDLGASSLNETWLRALLLEDPLFDLDAFDNDMLRAFKHNATLNELERIVRQNQGRRHLAHRYYSERDAQPLFVIGDIDHDHIAKLSTTQPIIHIQLREGDQSLRDIMKTIRYCLPQGPYFLMWDDERRDALADMIDKYARGAVETCVTSSQTDIEACQQAHHGYMVQKVAAKLTALNSILLIDLDDPTCQSLQSILLREGLTAAECAVLYQQPIQIRFTNIRSPSQLKGLLNDTILKQFKQAEFEFGIDRCLFSKAYFESQLTDHESQKIVWQTHEQLFIHASDMDQAVIQWFQDRVNQLKPHATQTEKHALFDSFYLYARRLSQLASGRTVEQPEVDPLLEHELLERATELGLFDPFDNQVSLAFQAAPIERDPIHDNVIYFLDDELCRHLQQHERPTENPFANRIPPQNQGLLERLDRLSHEANMGGSRPPLFILPPLTGDDSYAALIESLSPQQPVYSFIHPLLSDQPQPFDSIEALATYYRECIEARYPKGPVYLAGWSFGGIVANEIAVQLQAKGRDIAYLGIIDSPTPNLIQEHQAEHLSLFTWLCDIYHIPQPGIVLTQIEALLSADLSACWTHLKSHISNVLQTQPQEAAYIIKGLEVCEMNYSACFGYHPNIKQMPNRYVYQSTVASSYPPVVAPKNLGWPIADDHCHMIVGATHFTITMGEHAESLAQLMSQNLSQHELSLLDEAILRHVYQTRSHNRTLLPPYYVDIHDMEFLDEAHSWMILGDSGIGKSTLLRHYYDSLAHDYLESTGSESIPLFFSFSQHGSIQAYFASLSLSELQITELLRRNVTIIIDGVDEVSVEAFKQSMEYSRRYQSDSIRYVLTCKEQYYRHTPAVSTYTSHFTGCKIHTLNDMNETQCEAVILGSLKDTDPERQEWHKSRPSFALPSGSQHTLTPRYLQQLVQYGYLVAEQADFELKVYPRTQLFAERFKTIAEKSNFSLDVIIRFCKRLTLSLYGLDDEFLEFIAQDRSDTQEIIDLLNLQRTAKGLAFSHRSDQEYFLALIMFEEVKTVEYDGVLNQLNLCYEHDVLGYIRELYHDFLSHAPDSDNCRQWLKCILYYGVHLARGNSEFKTLAANCISIIVACNDFKMPLPQYYNDVFLGPVNLTNALVADCDFSQAHVDEAILDGAVITDNKRLPSRWRNAYSYDVRPVGYFKSIECSSDGDVYALEKTLGDVAPDEAYTFVNLITNEVIATPKLQMPGHQRSRDPGVIVRHPSGDFFAVLSIDFQTCTGDGRLYESRKGTSARLQMFDHDGNVMAIQTSETAIDDFTKRMLDDIDDKRGNTDDLFSIAEWYRFLIEGLDGSESYYLIAEGKLGREPIMKFHPRRPTLYALCENNIDFYIFDPTLPGPTIIKEFCSELKDFIVSETLNAIIYVSQHHLVLRSLDAPYEIINRITLDGIAYQVDEEHNEVSGLVNRLVKVPHSTRIIIESHTDDQHNLMVFDIEHAMVLHKITIPQQTAGCVVHDSGTKVVYAYQNKVDVWDIDSQMVHTAHCLSIENCIKTNFGLELHGDTIYVYYLNTSKTHRLLETVNLSSQRVEFSAQTLHPAKVTNLLHNHKRGVVVSTSLRQLTIRDTQSLACLTELTFEHNIERICFSDDENYLFIAENKSYVHVYDLVKGQILHKLTIEDVTYVTDVKIDPCNPDILLIGFIAKECGYLRCLWKPGYVLPAPDKSAGYYILTCPTKNMMTLYSRAHDAEGTDIYVDSQHQEKCKDYLRALSSRTGLMAFSQNSSTLYITNLENSLHYQLSFRRAIWQENEFEAVMFSPDDHYLLTSHISGHVNIWDTRKRFALRKSIVLPSSYATAMSFTNEGDLFITTASGSLFIYNDRFKLVHSRSSNHERLLGLRSWRQSYFLLRDSETEILKVYGNDGQLVINILHRDCTHFCMNALWHQKTSYPDYIFIAEAHGRVILYDLDGKPRYHFQLDLGDSQIKTMTWIENNRSLRISDEALTSYSIKFEKFLLDRDLSIQYQRTPSAAGLSFSDIRRMTETFEIKLQVIVQPTNLFSGNQEHVRPAGIVPDPITEFYTTLIDTQP